MSALTNTNSPRRHVTGDITLRHYDLSGNNGDTFSVSGNQQVIQAIFQPTTAISVGLTRSRNVITFATGGAFAGRLSVWTRA